MQRGNSLRRKGAFLYGIVTEQNCRETAFGATVCGERRINHFFPPRVIRLFSTLDKIIVCSLGQSPLVYHIVIEIDFRDHPGTLIRIIRKNTIAKAGLRKTIIGEDSLGEIGIRHGIVIADIHKPCFLKELIDLMP